MTTGLRVIKPIPVTDAVLYTTDVIEADYAAWDSGTTYGLTARVILTSTHKIYESIQATNLNHPPDTSAAYWIEVSPTNRWKCFDTSTTTATAKSTSMSYTLRPGQAFDSVALLNCTGVNSVRLRVVDATYGTLYDQTTIMGYLPSEAGWHEWAFGARAAKFQLIATDIQGVMSADLMIDLTGTTDMAVGVILFGSASEIGRGVKYGAKIGIQDYSRKETNTFGDTVLVQRAFARRATFDIELPTSDIDATQMMLTTLRAVPCLWVGTDAYESTAVFGFFKNFDILISYPTLAACQLDLEGLT